MHGPTLAMGCARTCPAATGLLPGFHDRIWLHAAEPRALQEPVEHRMVPTMPDSSKPMAEHRPETLPVYELVVRTTSGAREKSATVGIKNTGLDIYLECGIVLHYDLEGRLLRVADPPLQWRRGLSHRTVRLRRRPRQEGAGFTAHLLDPAEADALVDRVCGDVKPIANNIAAGHFSIERHATDSRFDITTLTKLMHSAASFDSVGTQGCHDFSEHLRRCPDLAARSVQFAGTDGDRRLPLQSVHILRFLS